MVVADVGTVLVIADTARSKCTGAKHCERGSPVPKKVGRLHFPDTSPASSTAILLPNHVFFLFYHTAGAAEKKATRR